MDVTPDTTTIGPQGGTAEDLYPEDADEYARLLSWAKRAFEDAERARKPYEERWKRYYQLYRMYQPRDPKDWRSRVFVPVIFWVVETITPRLVAQLPKVLVLPMGPEDVQPASQMEELLDWASQNADLFIQLVLATKASLKYGTGIVKTFWRQDMRTARRPIPQMQAQTATMPVPIADPEDPTRPLLDVNGMPAVENRDVEVGPPIQVGTTWERYQYTAYDGPAAEAVDIFNFFPAPEATDVDDARYVIHRTYRPMTYVRRLVDQGVFRMPDNFSFSELADVTDEPLAQRLDQIGLDGGQTHANELRRPVELHEIWTDDGRVIVMGNRKALLRVAANPFDHGEKPFCRIVDYLQEHEFWGVGEAEAQEGLQDAQNALVNQRIDNVRLALDRMFLVNENNIVDRGDLKRRPGGVIRVHGQIESLEQAVVPVEVPDVTASSYREAEELQNMVERTSGVNAYTQGQDSPSLNDTATGISLLLEAGNTRFALKTTLAELMGLKRLARQWGALIQQFIDEQKIIRILGPKGEILWRTFDPESIQGALDYDIETASSTQTETIRKQQAMSLLQVLSGYLPPVPATDPMTGQPIVDPATGQPAMQPSPGIAALIEDVLTAFGKKDVDRYLGQGEQQDIANMGPTGPEAASPEAMAPEMAAAQGNGQFPGA